MKYIIELEEIKGTELYKAKGANTLVFDKKSIENILTPYEEPKPKTENELFCENLAVDTPIWVWNDGKKHLACFAKYDKERDGVMAFNCGLSSKDMKRSLSWKHAELAVQKCCAKCHLAKDNKELIEAYGYVIKALEQKRWIPVSEKLPENDGDYLLFGKVVEDDTQDTFIGTYDACAEKFGYWENYYDKNTLGFLDSELIEYNKVVAWMHLPEPYTNNVKGSEDEEWKN